MLIAPSQTEWCRLTPTQPRSKATRGNGPDITSAQHEGKKKKISSRAQKTDSWTGSKSRCSVHPAIGRWDLCSGDRLPKARSRWRNPASPSPSRSTARPPGLRCKRHLQVLSPPRHPPSRGPVTRALRSPPRRPWGTSSSGPQLRRSRAGASASWQDPASGQDLPRAPGGARARGRPCPVPELNGRSGPPPPREVKPGPGCLSRRFRFVFPTVGLPGRRDALRAAGSQGPWQRPPVARRARLPEIREGGADPGQGTAEARAAGRDRASSRGVRGARSGCVRSRVHSETSGEGWHLRPQVTTVAWKTRGEQGEVASDNKLEVGVVASSPRRDRRPPAAPGRAPRGRRCPGLASRLAPRGALSPALRVCVCPAPAWAAPARPGSQRSRLAGSCRSRAPGAPSRHRCRRRSGARRGPPTWQPGSPWPCLRVSPAPESRVSARGRDRETRASVLLPPPYCILS